MEEKPIKILLANDHSLFRSAIKTLLHKTSHILIIAEADSFPDIYSKLQECQPDILMTDDQMPGGNSISDLPRIKELYPELKIIVNTMFRDKGYLNKLMQLTDGLLSFNSMSEEFIKAIETAHYGGFYYYIPGLKKKIPEIANSK